MAKKLGKTDILHLAELCRLKLTENEVKSISTQLGDVLGYFEEMSLVDTNKTDPTSQTTGLVNIWREDLVDKKSCFKPEDALLNAGEQKNNLFKVPLVLKK